MVIEWKYTRTYKRHFGMGSSDKTTYCWHPQKWVVEACLCRYGAFHKKEDGYNLLRYDQQIDHGLSVNELKLKAQELEDEEAKGQL
jgi:hypothetical protein